MTTTMKQADDEMHQLLQDIASDGFDRFDDCCSDTQKRLTYLYMAGYSGDDVTADVEITDNIVEIFAAQTPTEHTEARLKMCRKIEEMARDATKKYVDGKLPGYVSTHRYFEKQDAQADLHTALEDIALMPLMRKAIDKCGR